MEGELGTEGEDRERRRERRRRSCSYVWQCMNTVDCESVKQGTSVNGMAKERYVTFLEHNTSYPVTPSKRILV